MWQFDNKTPIYLQIIDQLILRIITHHYTPGDKIPSVRDLAIETKTNPNTIQKALTELENQGFIVTQRTNGKFVTTDLDLIKRYRQKITKQKMDGFLTEMLNLGITIDDIIEELKEKKGK